MDSPVEEIQYTKAAHSANQDGTKKKKSTRKKPEAKAPKTVDLEVQETPTDPNQDINTDLIQHAYKLEHELAITKKKLKNQRRKFRQLIYSLAKYIDAKGITANIVDEYVRGIRPQITADEDSENDYDKFYSTYKYVVLDEHSQSNGKVITANGHKSASKPSSNMLKGSTTTDQDQDAIVIETPQDTAVAAHQKTTKTGRPKKDPATKEPKANGEEPKKRKNKKQKEGEDRKASVEAIDLEEIPNPNSAVKAKKDDNAFQIPALDENSNSSSRGMMRPTIPNLDPTEIMKAYMMNPTALGMNIPGMGMIPGLQGMQISENDMAMFSKVMEEMAKGGLGNILSGADMMNFYPGNFK